MIAEAYSLVIENVSVKRTWAGIVLVLVIVAFILWLVFRKRR